MRFENLRIKISLILTFTLSAILYGSIGSVILQIVSSWSMAKEEVSILEAFNSLPAVLTSLFLASYLPKIGYKLSLIIILSLVVLLSLIVVLFPSFTIFKLFFIVSGSSVAIVRISVYGLAGLLINNKKEYTSLITFMEGFYILGFVFSYWIFASFVNLENPTSNSWINVYWLLAFLCFINVLNLLFTKFPNIKHSDKNVSNFIFKVLFSKLVFVFVFSLFLYVGIEHSITSWLPTFNHQVLSLPNDLSLQLASVFAICMAFGSIISSFLLRYISYNILINTYLIIAIILFLIILPLSNNNSVNMTLFNIPLVAYIFPLTGMFLAPIYPMITTALLSRVPIKNHSQIVGLFVVFGPLAGMSGSMITGYNFGNFGGQTAFYLLLIPLILLFFVINFAHKLKV